MSLVSITAIKRIVPIQNFDSQVGAILLNGNSTTVEWDEFEEGEFVVCIRAGAWVPHDWAPFLVHQHENNVRVSAYGIIGSHLKERRFGDSFTSNSIILKLNRFPVWEKWVRDEFAQTRFVSNVPRLSKKNVCSVGSDKSVVTVEEFLQQFDDLDSNCNVYPYEADTNKSLFEYIYNIPENHKVY